MMKNAFDLKFSADLLKKFVRDASYGVILVDDNGFIIETADKLLSLSRMTRELFIDKKISASRRAITIDFLDHEQQRLEKFSVKCKKIKKIELILRKNIKLKLKGEILPVIYNERNYYVIIVEDELNSEGYNLDATRDNIESQSIYADVKSAVKEIIQACESLNESYSLFLPQSVSDNLRLIIRTLRDWE